MEYSNKPSPWEKSNRKLPAQSQKEFDFHNSDVLLKVLDDVLKATNTARETCREKMWKISWKGKNIVLRDIADKTIEWVNKFKTLGNVIAQGDPVHAAIPWVPVRYLIEVCSMIYTCIGHTLFKSQAQVLNSWQPMLIKNQDFHDSELNTCVPSLPIT
jgi:hypothetical protein